MDVQASDIEPVESLPLVLRTEAKSLVGVIREVEEAVPALRACLSRAVVFVASSIAKT